MIPGLVGGPNGDEVTENDIVLFVPTTPGANTAGTFSFLFDGSDVDLVGSSEDIDALHVADDGTIFVSTIGTPAVGTLSGLRDEDVLMFVPSSMGSITAGSWSLFFDGSDVGMTSGGADTNALTLDAMGQMNFSTTGTLSAGGITAADEDIVRFSGTFGPPSSGVLSLLFDLSALGIAVDEDVDGLHYVGP